MRTVNVRIPEELLQQIDNQLERVNKPEFIRAATLANKGVPVGKTSRNEFILMLIMWALDTYEIKEV